MTVRRILPGTVAAAGALAVAATLLPTAAADPLAGARARAAALARQVTRITDRAEVASQRYDAIEARLAGAVNGALSSDRQTAALRSAARQANARAEQRVQALYASGGSIDLLAGLLSGDATQTVTRTQISASALQANIAAVSRDRALAALAGQQAGQRHLSATRLVALQRAAARTRNRIEALLARQRAALAQADATVRRLVAQRQQAAAVASARSFAAAVRAAGGHLNGGTTPPNQIAAAAITAAESRIGDPYVWGASGPAAFDCSGLTQWSYAHAGIVLPRTAAEQWYAGPHPSLANLEPGDLLFWATDPNDPATIHHVTIYIGNGEMVAAPHTGTDVQIQPVYFDGFFGATRPWATG